MKRRQRAERDPRRPPPRQRRAERERHEHERPGTDERDEARLVEVAAAGERERRRARERDDGGGVKGSGAHGHVRAGAAATPEGAAPRARLSVWAEADGTRPPGGGRPRRARPQTVSSSPTKSADRRHGVRGLVEQEVADAGEHPALRPPDVVGPHIDLLDRDDPVGVAPQEQGRHRETVQPARQPRVVGPLPQDARGRRGLAEAVREELGRRRVGDLALEHRRVRGEVREELVAGDREDVRASGARARAARAGAASTRRRTRSAAVDRERRREVAAHRVARRATARGCPGGRTGRGSGARRSSMRLDGRVVGGAGRSRGGGGRRAGSARRAAAGCRSP